MDEDYDACDLENWFLAIQSADGQVIIPSFHRPGIVTANDWSRTMSTTGGDAGLQLLTTRAMSRILRPRQVDGHSSIAFPDLTPDGNSGRIVYDVDNDGDGTTDSVWLDLGYPPKRSPEGQLFKPLFAFMVIGLNGRLPLNTAGNLQDRDNSLNPLFDHTEHLGVSPSEIDIEYALQNAYDPNFTANSSLPLALQGNYTQGDNAGTLNRTGPARCPTRRSPSPDPVERNILTGTRPWVTTGANGDANIVVVNGQNYNLPNNMADISDTMAGGGTWQAGQTNTVSRTNPSVAGRWGESDYVPQALISPFNSATSLNVLVFNNAIRAGYSIDASGAAWDARDDNFNTYDWYLGESGDYYDAAGALALPVERIRRFVTPIDMDANGRVITFGGYNPGGAAGARIRQNGADVWGRVNFYAYFRPPGIPMLTANAFVIPGTASTPITTPAPIDLTNTATTAMSGPLWYDGPAVDTSVNISGTLPNTLPTYPRWDVRTNNPYHGFFSSLAPDFKSEVTSPPASMTRPWPSPECRPTSTRPWPWPACRRTSTRRP